MLAGKASSELGWPNPDAVFDPKIPARRVLVDLAQTKLGIPLARANADVRVGVLPSELASDKTESPLALVCEFSRQPSSEQLDLAHKLAWNLCKSRLLITLERQRLRAWSCCVPPTKGDDRLVYDDGAPPGHFPQMTSVSDTALHALHWISLTSGDFFQRREPKFRKEGRADSLLLQNLRDVRKLLLDDGVPKSVCHDLLARLIFVQYLFQRKDSQGKPFLDETLLRGRLNGKLSKEYRNLEEILRHRDDTYSLFHWLNETFNGDLFPGKGETAQERKREWDEERKHVTAPRLERLAEFVSGSLQIRGRQKTLWPMYSFDTIPLEFISSVYEQFVSEDAHRNKAYYTRSHLVDYMLDSVLPWDSEEWNLRILDPCCGSGIFLVKALERLIHRWRNAHPDSEPSVPELKSLLTKNLFGVDIDPEAVRVASFSLYLAMCDAIDPRHYWKQTVFPRLRDRNLIAKDFFLEDVPGIRTNEDARTFDLVLGNAPWGKNTIKKESPAAKWSKKNEWPTTYNDIGPLFLAKASKLAKADAWVSMIQPANVLLFNRSSTANTLRAAIFSLTRVSEITNLSALRFVLFNDAVGPACTVTYQNREPLPEDLVVYISPKEGKTSEDSFRVIIEPNDIHEFVQRDARQLPHIWTALAWGTWRDVELVERLRNSSCLESLRKAGKIRTGEGLIRGSKQKRYEWLLNRHILEDDKFPDDVFLYINADSLPINQNPMAERPRKPGLFAVAQLIVKQSWLAETGRFQAAMVQTSHVSDGCLCSDSYVSVSADRELTSHLHAACLVFNSSFATYYQLLTSGRLAAFIPIPLESELRRIPLPMARDGVLKGLTTHEEIDRRVNELFGFKPAERILIEDLFEFTLPDFKGDGFSPGRQPTPRRTGQDPDLRAYADQFMRVLRAGFGEDKEIRATILQESEKEKLPVRLLAIHLHWPQRDKAIDIESLETAALLERLTKLHDVLMKPYPRATGIVFERHARIYAEHPTKRGPVPTLFLIKPDQRRHWTRSQAMRDADEVAAEVLKMKWAGEAS